METRRLREDRDNKMRSESEQPHSKPNQNDTEAAPVVTTAPGEHVTETTDTDQPS
jgi:hypothetical protein